MFIARWLCVRPRPLPLKRDGLFRVIPFRRKPVSQEESRLFRRNRDRCLHEVPIRIATGLRPWWSMTSKWVGTCAGAGSSTHAWAVRYAAPSHQAHNHRVDKTVENGIRPVWPKERQENNSNRPRRGFAKCRKEQGCLEYFKVGKQEQDYHSGRAAVRRVRRRRRRRGWPHPETPGRARSCRRW